MCDPSCKTCSGSTSTTCLSCDSTGLKPYFYNFACYSECPNGTYLNSTTLKCSGIIPLLSSLILLITSFQTACHSSCATCSGPSNTTCTSCQPSLYFTSPQGTCTAQCSSPYSAVSKTKTCEIQALDAHGLNSTLQSLMTDTLSSSSNMSTESKGDFLASLSTIIADFNAENYGTDSNSNGSSLTTCTTCSGNGECGYNELYLTDTCQCDDGWDGDSCSISEVDRQALQDLTQKILNEIRSVPLRLTMSAVWSKPYLDALLTLTNPSFCALSDVQSALEIVDNLITSDYNQKTTADEFDPVKMTVTAQIINSCMSYIYKNDCYLQTITSQQIYNTSLQALTKLAALQLWQKAPNSGSYTLDTTDFQLYSERVTADQLNGYTIAPPNAPIIVLQQASSSSSSLSSTEPVDIQVVFWKNNLMACPQTKKEDNSPPLVSLSLNNQDTIVTASYASQLSAEISYPISSGGQTFTNCSSGCDSSVVTSSDGNKYFKCTCQSLSSLSTQSQALGLFARSELYKIFLAGALATFDYLGSWAFWMLWSMMAWLLLTLFAIKARIVTPFTYQAPCSQYSMGSAERPRKNINIRNMRWIKAIYYGIKVRRFLILSSFLIKLVWTCNSLTLFVRG